MLAWLKKLPKPVAIWSVSDAWATRLLEGCRRLELLVPEDVAVLGTTNDSLICEAISPPLSSIELHSRQIGYLAARRLSLKMKRKPVPEEIELVPPIGVIARLSTDTVAFPDPEIVKVLRLIRDNALTGISVDRIAKETNLSRSTLQRHFRNLVGRTIENEIMRHRIDRAKRLLRETTLSLSKIAQKTGFSNTDYFIQAFRRETGTTPNRLRKSG